MRLLCFDLASASLLLLQLGSANPAPAATAHEAHSTHGDYLGRYQLNDDLVLVVGDEDGLLTLLPSFWRTTQILQPDAQDTFHSLLHREIGFRFHRDAQGAVSKLEVTGHDEIDGLARRLPADRRLPVEALLDGEADEALRLLYATNPTGPQRALGLAVQLLLNYPSQSETAGAFLDGVTARHPNSAAAQAARGAAWVAAGDRKRALAAYHRAIELDAESSWAKRGLRHLDPGQTDTGPDGWRVPFPLADLFSPPTTAEIREVRALWKERDLAPLDVNEVAATSLQTHSADFKVRVISHSVHGELHYAAILVPKDATPGCCPVILDVPGITWDYRARRLNAGLRSIDSLRDSASRFVFAVPSLRGETLQVDGVDYLSEGDGTDGWGDGAADDTIALLSVALATTREADPDRACVFGKSRGATVALLAAARDPRFDCVVAWAGPADWFGLMGTLGWTFEEQVAEGLRNQWRPGQGGSATQFIEWFLRGPIDEGSPSLGRVRARVAASSPLYFADTLPPGDLQYGVEDRSVPVANGAALRDRLTELGRSAPDYAVTLHEVAGHDLPYPKAYDRSREFLLRHLADPPPD